MNANALLAPIDGTPGPVTLNDPEGWMQGRTMYGGASSLIAFRMATRAFPGLPPLRAAHIGFVAPIGADIELSCEMVRQGKSVAQVRSEIRCDGAIALTSLWLFGAGREPNALHPSAALPDWPGLPETGTQVKMDAGPRFLRENFELRRAQDERGKGEPMVRRWCRLNDRSGLTAMEELVLLGDALPPGAMRVMQRHGPNSSMNWAFNVLDPEPQTQDGWWLGMNSSEHADNGYSSERLMMYDANGKLVLSGLQAAAIFG